MMIYWQGNVTDHFTKDEYAGKGNGGAIMTKESYIQCEMMEDFRVWLNRPIYVTSWYRTPEKNKEVGGISTSNHLLGCATDWHTDIAITEAKFIKYAKKWKAICRSRGVVGEAGLYSWGMHTGYQNPDQVKANKGKFFNWDSRSGKQKNNAFKI